VEDHLKRVITPNLRVLTKDLSAVLFGFSSEKKLGFL
jgi:hypothetical protein